MWSKQLGRGENISRSRTLLWALLVLPTISFVVACFAFSTPVSAAQTVPYKINFQGRLTNVSGVALSGAHDMQFKLYTAVSGGTYVWGETRTAANGNAVAVTNGLFSVLIGEGTAVAGSSATLQAAIAANTTLFMEVTVGLETLSPRSQFGSSAYAFNSDMLDGLDATAFGQLSIANTWTNTNLVKVTSAAALSVQSASTGNVLSVDTSAGEVELGSAALAGKLVISDGANSTVTLSLNTITGDNNYTLAIPAITANDTICLQGASNCAASKFVGSGSTSDSVDLATAEVSGTLAATNGGTGHGTTAVGDMLVGAGSNTWNKVTIGGNGTCLTSNGTTAAWGSCSGGALTLQGAYSGDSDGGDAIIALTTTDGGIRIQDAATPLATAFSVENNGGTAAYFTVSSTGVAMNDGSSRPTFLMDNTTHELRVYENVASSPRYAKVYYDTGANAAIFAASSGTTQIGTAGGGGDISLSLSGAATDKLNATKAYALSGAYSGSDFNFTRSLTGTSYAMSGNVMKIEDSSGFTGGSSSPNLLYINQANVGATGNLILAQTGGSTDKFKVDVSGNVTAAGGVTSTSGNVTIAAGSSYTGAGAVTVSSASNTNLTLLSGGTSKTLIKPGTDSASSFEVQDSAGASLLLANTTDDRIVVGVSDTVGTTLVLDTKTSAGDPTGVDGAMYYNSDAKDFRCYKNGLWSDCNFKSLRSEWVLQEDFNSNTIVAGTTADLGNIGNENWTFVSIGTGGTLGRVNVGTDASNRDRMGVMQLNSPATVSTGASVRLDNTGIAGVPSNMTVEFDFGSVNAAAATGLQTITRIGLHDSVTTAAPTDGMYFQYSTTTAAGNWFRCTQVTCVDTGVARTTTLGVYQRFKIQTNSAGTAVEFFINEASVGTASANLPGATAVYGPTINTSTVDATIRQWKIDYFQIYRSLSTLR